MLPRRNFNHGVLFGACSLAAPALAGDGFADRLGPRLARAAGSAPARHARRQWWSPNAVLRWNDIALDSTGIDHTPPAPGESRVFGEQLGPGRSARAMAVVHLGMAEAVNAMAGAWRSWAALAPARSPLSLDAAVAQAAHDTLAALYQSQADVLNELLAEDLARHRHGEGVREGLALGQRAAAAVLALRADDGAQHAEPRVGVDYLPSDAPGHWRQDPVSLIPLAMGAHWGAVRPFALTSAQQFRLPPPPALTSRAYTASFDQVKRLGGDGVATPTQRTEEQSRIGLYWAYDGTPTLCAPPRLYNQIAVLIAQQRRTPALEMARVLALVNVAQADAAIAAWDSKYHHKRWRPVCAIREADVGSGLSGAGDGNPDTVGDAAFMPLGAPASNLMGPNFTPPFPAYPSGHATLGGALFQTLRRCYGTDRIAFTFVSDELNGVTRDHQGQVRLLWPRRFETCRRPSSKMGGAASTWASTGPTTSTAASPRAGRSPTR